MALLAPLFKTGRLHGVRPFLAQRTYRCATCVLHRSSRVRCSPLSFPSGPNGSPLTTLPPTVRSAPYCHLVCGSLARTDLIRGTQACPPARNSCVIASWPGRHLVCYMVAQTSCAASCGHISRRLAPSLCPLALRPSHLFFPPLPSGCFRCKISAHFHL